MSQREQKARLTRPALDWSIVRWPTLIAAKTLCRRGTRSIFPLGPPVPLSSPYPSLLAAVSVSKSCVCNPAVWRTREHCVLSSHRGLDVVLFASVCELWSGEPADQRRAEWGIVTATQGHDNALLVRVPVLCLLWASGVGMWKEAISN